MKVRPLSDKIIVKRKQEQEEKTPSGIIIPTAFKEKPAEGEVLAVGPGRTLDNGKVHPVDVKVGDKILFSKHNFVEVKLEGEDYLILGEDAVLAVLPNG